jgi:hypothetical protein
MVDGVCFVLPAYPRPRSHEHYSPTACLGDRDAVAQVVLEALGHWLHSSERRHKRALLDVLSGKQAIFRSKQLALLHMRQVCLQFVFTAREITIMEARQIHVDVLLVT